MKKAKSIKTAVSSKNYYEVLRVVKENLLFGSYKEKTRGDNILIYNAAGDKVANIHYNRTDDNWQLFI